jgi:4'-phosphopantetheinyl transferase
VEDTPALTPWRALPLPLELVAGEVHVVRFGLDREPEQVAVLRSLLSDEERTRADRFLFPQHRDRFAVGRGVLRQVLGGCRRQAPESLRFEYGPQGKPSLADDDLRFNLSHAAGLALLALGRGVTLGVDVEDAERTVDHEGVGRRFFSPAEHEVLMALPEGQRRQGFFNAWTRKEAFIKAKGGGLSIPLDSFAVTLRPGEPARLLWTRDDPAEASRWTLLELSPGVGFAGALMVEGTPARVSLWELP